MTAPLQSYTTCSYFATLAASAPVSVQGSYRGRGNGDGTETLAFIVGTRLWLLRWALLLVAWRSRMAAMVAAPEVK